MPPLPQVAPDTSDATAYDSVWANPDVPVQSVSWLDQLMLSQDKLFVVMAVALIIWFGLAFFLFRTDRKLHRLEQTLQERTAEKELDSER